MVMVVRQFGGRFPVISLDELEALFRASSVELGRRFGARRVGDKYLLPIQAVPWFTLIDLGREYPIGGLIIRGVVVDGPVDKPWLDIVLGFLVGDYVVGVSVVGRRAVGCRSRPLNPPLDLWDLPRGLDFPRPVAVTRDVSGNVVDVSAPMDCLAGLGVSPGSSTRFLLVYVGLVSVGGRVFIDLGGSSLLAS
ncbi:hypothetical protein Vdis_0647 [Vulcanisaeta distributa DSM 14429]|uniref:Uncharacterized protein n=2 Tax=Vulcanisaeta distributa TaxID=164451 RepID=E1QVB5_VULDI|nr:hypothetical protein Vdis_0647 [Vulcanisaeta distributa DSM 14429]